MRTIAARLDDPIDGAGLAAFRFAFGLVLFFQTLVALFSGRAANSYLDPPMRFTYLGFGWIEPAPGLEYVFVVSAFLALCVATGFLYRLTAPLFFLCRTYVFLLERTEYLNHEYLVCLLAFLLALVPAHRTWSIDAAMRPGVAGSITRRHVMPLLAMIAIVYTHAGIAKLNSDWLMGEPIRAWLARRTDTFLIGPLLDEPFAAWFFAYGGLGFDLLVIPALVWRRTRTAAAAASLAFHGLNKLIFDIGVFPWIMLAAMTLFFSPDWPRRLLRRAPRPVAPAEGPGLAWRVFIGVFLTIQVLVPLRHLLYPGTVHWTEEGHEFSWHMKLRDKEGVLDFVVVVPETGREFTYRPDRECTDEQMSKLVGRPDLIHQFAIHVRDVFAARGVPGVRVHARSRASLNGRPLQLFIDPRVDLASEPRSMLPSRWIVPLTTPLR